MTTNPTPNGPHDPHPGTVYCYYTHKCMRLNTIWGANCKNNDALGDFYSPQEWWYNYPRITWFSIEDNITTVSMDTTNSSIQEHCNLLEFYDELGRVLDSKAGIIQRGEDNFQPHK